MVLEVSPNEAVMSDMCLVFTDAIMSLLTDLVVFVKGKGVVRHSSIPKICYYLSSGNALLVILVQDGQPNQHAVMSRWAIWFWLCCYLGILLRKRG